MFYAGMAVLSIHFSGIFLLIRVVRCRWESVSRLGKETVQAAGKSRVSQSGCVRGAGWSVCHGSVILMLAAAAALGVDGREVKCFRGPSLSLLITGRAAIRTAMDRGSGSFNPCPGYLCCRCHKIQ